MRAFERRESDCYPYFKLATWQDRWMAWQPAKSAFPTEAAAVAAARKPGRYRITRVDDQAKTELEPFTV